MRSDMAATLALTRIVRIVVNRKQKIIAPPVTEGYRDGDKRQFG
jgi:hypothetical protein